MRLFIHENISDQFLINPSNESIIYGLMTKNGWNGWLGRSHLECFCGEVGIPTSTKNHSVEVRLTGPWFNIKVSFYRHEEPRCRDKTDVRSFLIGFPRVIRWHLCMESYRSLHPNRGIHVWSYGTQHIIKQNCFTSIATERDLSSFGRNVCQWLHGKFSKYKLLM